MNQNKRTIIKSYLKDYLHLRFKHLQIKDGKSFKCPFCEEHENDNGQNTAVVYANKPLLFCFHPPHKTLGDIFELARKIDGLDKLSDDSIGEYLIQLLDIKIKTDNTDKLFSMYKNSGFGLFPLTPNSKNPVSGVSWLKNISFDVDQWREWYDNGLGLALPLGKVTKTIAIDVDSDETEEKVKNILNTTATQQTKRGKHRIYNYHEDFSFLNHANVRTKNGKPTGYDMEVRCNNAYVVVAPTSVEGEVRSWNEEKIQDMTPEAKKFLLELIDKKESPKKDEEVQKAIDNEKLDVVDLSGRRNDTFLKTAGVFSKWMTREQLEKTLSFLSHNWIDKPIPKNELYKMLEQIKKYRSYDKEELGNLLLDRLEIVEESTAFKLSATLKLEQKNVEEVLKSLVDEEKITKEGEKYRKTNKPNWKTNFMDVGKKLSFPVPFFDEVAKFKEGSMIIIGGVSGSGKSTLCGNFLKFYKDKGIVPYLLSSEKTSGIEDVASTLGLVEGDFKFCHTKKLYDVELEDNSVSFCDWVRPSNSEYFKMDTIFENLDIQANKHGGLLIVFVQLRKSNNGWYAPDLIDHNASLACKFLHSEVKDGGGNVIGHDRENVYFQITKIRKPQNKRNPISIIPLKYNPDTDMIKLRK